MPSAFTLLSTLSIARVLAPEERKKSVAQRISRPAESAVFQLILQLEPKPLKVKLHLLDRADDHQPAQGITVGIRADVAAVYWHGDHELSAPGEPFSQAEGRVEQLGIRGCA